MTLTQALGVITQQGQQAIEHMGAIRKTPQGFHVALAKSIDGREGPFFVQQRRLPDPSQTGIAIEFEPCTIDTDELNAEDWQPDDLLIFS